MSFPKALLRRRRTREPLDERLPDGRSVSELINDQILTPTNRAAVVRPRETTPAPAPVDAQQQAAEQSLTNQGFKGAMMRPRRA